MNHPFNGRRLCGLLGIIAALGLTCASALAVEPSVDSRLPLRAAETTAAAAGPLDIDGNGVLDALTDGLLLLRYFMGITGDPLIVNALGPNPTRNSSQAVADYIASFAAGAPAGCAIGASPASSSGSPLPANTSVQLTASCQSGAANFTWSTGATGPSITVAPAQATSYVAVPSTPQAVGSPASTTVYVTGGSGGTTGPPSGCSTFQYPNTAQGVVPQGTMVDLVVRCTGGFPPTSCAWTGGVSSNACNIRVAAPAVTTTYSVTPSNPFGGSGAVSTTVNVGGAVTDVCTQSAIRYTITWPPTGQVRLQTSNFAGQIVAFKVVVPTTFNPPLNNTHLGFISLAEVPGTPPTPREMTVSRIACDFQSGNYLYNGTGNAATSPSVNFTANNANYASVGGDFNMNSGDTIYINVRNSQNGVPACGDSACNMLLDFATPNRY
jgi:hypothetical protein